MDDLYVSAMTPDFNWLHKLIYPRFFKKINVEVGDLHEIRELAKTTTIVYTTKEIGQLEYNFFNCLFLREGLPLAHFVNELSLWQWLPFAEIKHAVARRAHHFLKHGPLPNPVSSGYLKGLIEDGKSIFLQLKTSAIFDDLYMYQSPKDPIVALLEAHKVSKRPIVLLPLYFMWNKRPEGVRPPLIDLLPSNVLTRTLQFWRNYKNRAAVKIGKPIYLDEFVGKQNDIRRFLFENLKEEKKIITGPALKPRSWMIEQVIEDPDVQKAAYELAAERNKSPEDAKSLAKRYAKEIVTDINYSFVEICSRIMRWVLRNIYDGVVLDTEGLAKLKTAFAKAPIILVPNHRSHMDYLLLSSLLYDQNVTIPHVVAGLNLSFWPMGYIFRKCGAFFLRRTFGGNKFYRTVFKSYLKKLLKEGYCQEFFIEGGRTRTGKLLRPRTGMITMLSEAITECGEVYFIPVAITYDQIIEEYKNELAGEAKKPEHIRDLWHLKKYFRRKYGKIYLRFGDPIPFTSAESTQKLLNSIMITINRELVVTPMAVAAASILLSEQRGITERAITENAEEIIKYLKWRGARFSATLEQAPMTAVIEAVQNMVSARHLERHGEFEPVCYEIKEDRRIILDYYKNNIIHFFVSASVLATIMSSHLKGGRPKPTLTEMKEPYLFCKGLFSREFAFSTRMEVEEHIGRILGWFEGIEVGSNRFEVYKGMLINFFDGYLATLMTCLSMEPTEERALVKKIMRYSRHILLLGHIRRPEAISNPALLNAILSLVDLGILSQHKDARGRKIYSWANKGDLAANLQEQLEVLR